MRSHRGNNAVAIDPAEKATAAIGISRNIRFEGFNGGGSCLLERDVSQQWFLVAFIFAVPIVLFAGFELIGIIRVRKHKAVAHRRKGPDPR
jgi:hypothetical protein